MRRSFLIISLMALSLLLVACGGADTEALDKLQSELDAAKTAASDAAADAEAKIAEAEAKAA